MQRTEGSANPYQPPPEVHQSMARVIRSIQIGDAEFHTVTLESSIWTGLKTYATDASGVIGEVHRGPCDFFIGTGERHRVVVDVDRVGKVNVYVDGELVEENVLAELRAVLSLRITLVVVMAISMLTLFLYFWIRYEPDKVIDRWMGW